MPSRQESHQVAWPRLVEEKETCDGLGAGFRVGELESLATVVSDSFATPWTVPGSSVHEIFQVTILEWVAISYFRGSFSPRDRTHISCVSYIAGSFFMH